VTPWLLVAGDIVPVGGMDAANFALARHLAADPDVELHLVTHRVWDGFAENGRVRLHTVGRPFGAHAVGAPLIAWVGRTWAARLLARGGHAVVNGGNCRAADVTWVHYVHAAYRAEAVTGGVRRAKDRLLRRRELTREREILLDARLVLCNSLRTQRDVVERLGVPAERTRVIYYGIDPDRFARATTEDQATARRELGWAAERPVAIFIGALGDRRKGFDTLFDAWRILCRDPGWDCDLVAVGVGAGLEGWRRRAAALGMSSRLHLLGHRTDVDRLLAAADVLIHPARYEAYGLGVHEALCRGVPAFVSAGAGVAERYAPDAADLLIRDPDSPHELAERLRWWRAGPAGVRERVAAMSEAIRRRTWEDMAKEIVEVIER